MSFDPAFLGWGFRDWQPPASPVRQNIAGQRCRQFASSCKQLLATLRGRPMIFAELKSATHFHRSALDRALIRLQGEGRVVRHLPDGQREFVYEARP